MYRNSYDGRLTRSLEAGACFPSLRPATVPFPLTMDHEQRL